MLDRSRKRRRDPSRPTSGNNIGASWVNGGAGKNPAAVALGRLGGLKGGKARAATLSKARRAEIARQAAKARWKQYDR